MAIFLQNPTKPKYYFGNYFIKPKCYFGTYLQNSNIILTFVLHILNPSLMGNIITHLSRNTTLTRFIKAHVYHPWQDYSFCRDNQPKKA